MGNQKEEKPESPPPTITKKEPKNWKAVNQKTIQHQRSQNRPIKLKGHSHWLNHSEEEKEIGRKLTFMVTI